MVDIISGHIYINGFIPTSVYYKLPSCSNFLPLIVHVVCIHPSDPSYGVSVECSGESMCSFLPIHLLLTEVCRNFATAECKAFHIRNALGFVAITYFNGLIS